MSDYQVITCSQEPRLREIANKITNPLWPEYMHHDAVACRTWGLLYERAPEFQFVLREGDNGSIVAVANSVPLLWKRPYSELPDHGLDWALETALERSKTEEAPNVLCALAIVIVPEFRGMGLSERVVREMVALGRRAGLNDLIAPVRPSLKCLYPIIPAEQYIEWKNEDGLPFDPWMRVHARLGARVVKVCRRSMEIRGTVAEWESWTKMRFPDVGKYVVPGALVPVEVEREEGHYVEPNVWMVHTASRT